MKKKIFTILGIILVVPAIVWGIRKFIKRRGEE